MATFTHTRTGMHSATLRLQLTERKEAKSDRSGAHVSRASLC